MEEEEDRRRKLEAGKAKLAEYRQRKAQTGGQKMQKRKKKKRSEQEDVEQEVSSNTQEVPTTELTFSKTVHSEESVQKDQLFTLEPENTISTTAEDFLSEEEDLNPPINLQEVEDEPDARNMGLEELGPEFEISAAFGGEGLQQLQDFEAALKHRDGIITQLTSNLQQARTEKDEVMREFLQLTEQSQKLQLQFQQLQAGESLRNSSISSAAADLLQARQQILLYQQQLDDLDIKVTGLQMQLEERDLKVKSLEENMLQITKLREQERLSFEHRQSLEQLQDNLRASEQRFQALREQLTQKTIELKACEAELQTSKQREQLSSGEVLQLMGLVETLQKRCHQGSQSEEELLQREEQGAARRLDLLRAELDEMYGQQIVQMKQELSALHAEEMANIQNQQSREQERISEQHRAKTKHLTSQLIHSTGDVNILNVRVIELQQRLQETQVLREKAERNLILLSEEKILLQHQVQKLTEDLHLKSQSELHQQLQAVNKDLQTQLAAALEALSKLEAKHESEITNYQIKLDMLEREKDAVLDRMAESQEAELERLRTKLLFSHEEELSRLREDFQREGQLNMENLRDELVRRHHEAQSKLQSGYEESLRLSEDVRTVLAAERVTLLQEVVALKNDLSQALEKSRADELVSQLKDLQEEIHKLRQKQSTEEELEWARFKNEPTKEMEQSWESIRTNMENENKLLKERSANMADTIKTLEERHKVLLKEMESIASENKKLRAEVERQKNLEVNSQKLEEQMVQYETKVHSLESQNIQPMLSILTTGVEDTSDGGILEEKATTELMEKLQKVELERAGLAEQVQQKELELKKMELVNIELVEKINTKEAELKMVEQKKEADLRAVEMEKARLVEEFAKKEMELKRIDQERTELLKQIEAKEMEIKEMEQEKAGLVKQVVHEKAELQRTALDKVELVERVEQNEVELQRLIQVRAELVKWVEQKEAELKQKEAELQRMEQEKAGMVQQAEQKEMGLRQLELENAGLEQLVNEIKLELERKEVDSLEKVEPVQEACLKPKTEEPQRMRQETARLAEQKEVMVKQKEDKLQKMELQRGVGLSGEVQDMGLKAAKKEEQKMSGRNKVEVKEIKAKRKHQVNIKQKKVGLREEVGLYEKTRAVRRLLTPPPFQGTAVKTVCAVQLRDVKMKTLACAQPAATKTHTPRATTATHTHTEEQENVSHKQQVSHHADSESVPTLTLSMDGSEHVECRLQMEAQRISLSQIHAAQIELLEERLHTTTPECEDLARRGRGTDELHLSLSTITQLMDDLSRFQQLIVRVSGGNAVDLNDEQLQHLQTSTVREIIHTAQEVYKVLQQMNMSADVREVRRLRTKPDIFSKTEHQQDVRMKPEHVQEVQRKLEEVHEQEIERLKNCYSKQISECEERYTNEILLLHNKLEKLTGSEALYSMPSVSPCTQQQGQMEEEVARVIVQMSVDFAKQSEINRMNMLNQIERRHGEQGNADVQQGAQFESEVARGAMRSSSTQTQMLRDRGLRDNNKDKDEENEEEVTSLLPSSDTQDRLYHVIKEVLHTTVLMEETIRNQTVKCTDLHVMDTSLLLGKTAERLEVYQGPELPVEGEELVSSVSCRLQKAVERFIFIITETQAQLDHARLTQTALTKEKFSHDQQIAELMGKQEELQQRLQEERSARENLILKLQHAEGLIDGYSVERRILEEQACQAATLQLQLETELQKTSSRLQELQHEKHNINKQQELLLQQETLKVGASDSELSLVEVAGDDAPEAGFLEETEKLLQEKVDVQRQAQKDHAELLQQVKELEVELEEQMRVRTTLEETHLSESTDLRQQITAFKIQLEHNRRFLDEQAADREHEREIFQQEIQKLEEQLKSNTKPTADHREVEELSMVLKEKSDWCKNLLQREEHLQEKIRERDEEIERLEERLRALEETLFTDAQDTSPLIKEGKQHASMAGEGGATLEALLQTEREALDRKEKEIENLEEQLEQFRDELQNKSEEVQQLHMQLEIQRKEISIQQQELQAHTTLHMVLEQKDRQIELLNEQISKLQLLELSPSADQEVKETSEQVQELKAQVEYLNSEKDRLKRDNEEEVEQLNSVIEKLQQELSKIEHKQTAQEEEDNDERKQKMDQVEKELDTLREDHFLLRDKYETLQEEAFKREKEKQSERFILELEDLLREKTAALVVAQVQVLALKESALSRVTDLTQRVEELETCLEEKEMELKDCRLEVEKAQSDAGSLRLKILQLEEKLMEKTASLRHVVNQALDPNTQMEERESIYRGGEQSGGTVSGKELETHVHSQTVLDSSTERNVKSDKPTARKDTESQVQSQTPLDKPIARKEVESDKATTGKDTESQVQSQTPLDKPTAGKEVESDKATTGKDTESQVQSQTPLDKPIARKEVESDKATTGKDTESQVQSQTPLDKPIARKEVESDKATTGKDTESQVQSQTPLDKPIARKEVESDKATTGKDTESQVQSQTTLDKPTAGKEVKLQVQGQTTLEELNAADKVDKPIAGKEVESEVQSQTALEKLTVENEVESQIQTGSSPTAGLIGSSSEIKQETPMEKKNLLMERLKNLEEDLSFMQRDQELQKQLLTSSEEEVKLYEMRLAKLMELLNQMQIKPTLSAQAWSNSCAVVEDLQQQLQEVKAQSDAAQEELDRSKKLIRYLQEQIQLKESMNEKLQKDLLKVSDQSTNETAVSELQQELQEVKSQAEAAKEELKSCRMFSQNLHQQIQEREKMIAVLNEQLHQVTSEVDNFELLQELRDVKLEAASTKEELSSYIEHNLKLQEKLQAGEVSVSQLVMELQEVKTALYKSREEKEPPQSRKKSGRDQAMLKDKRRNSCVLEIGTQTEGTEPGVELEEVIGEYTERIEQIRELHAAEIMDMENRHIIESENLKREKQSLEEECDQLRTSIRSLSPALTQVMRADGPALRDNYNTDNSSDMGSRLKITPDGAQPDDTHLSNRIKTLLREVHQEGMQVLSLSEFSIDDDGIGDRNTLLAEITHLRARVEELQQQQCYTVETPGMFEGQRGQDDEREKIKNELAHVKLELETSLKTQLAYLRELDTLRAEVCVKVSDLDSLTDQLAETQKRARELQWEVERERSRAERMAEGERDELEDVRQALDEERLISAQRGEELTKHLKLQTQLQVQLESQRCQLTELTSDLQKEKELNAEFIKQLQHHLQAEDSTSFVAESVLQSLQAQLREKQAALVELMGQVEQMKLQELQQRQVWEEERKDLSHQVNELRDLLHREREQGKDTERELDRLQQIVTKTVEKNSQADAECWVFQQKSDEAIPSETVCTSVQNPAGSTDIKNTESVITKLQQISSNIKRLRVDDTDRECVAWIQKNVQDVMSLFQKVSLPYPAIPESTALLKDGSFSTLVERLLRQNAELTGFVSCLTEEKNELRIQMLRLEEELRRLRQLQAHGPLRMGSDGQEHIAYTEWETWKRQKNFLEKSLHQAEAEVSRLRREIRSETLRDLVTSDTENTTLKRVYGKYLRSESFRKALIYQKKYLLLLLGGFQECEYATLSLIARMAGPHLQTHPPRLNSVTPRRCGYTRFRTAARVCIAISRMCFLVRRWQRVTGGSINRNGLGQNPGMEVRNDSPYLQPYTERQGTNRGRSGQDSVHTTHATQHRYGLMSADGVLCSHPQNYDPDRALTDYITRLEALQRRLGAVQSGSSALHFGLRR